MRLALFLALSILSLLSYVISVSHDASGALSSPTSRSEGKSHDFESTRQSPLLAGCGLTFKAVSPAETLGFLKSLSGQWFDGLQAPELVGDAAVREGFTIHPSGILPSRFSVMADGSLLKETLALDLPHEFAIGPTNREGYRLVLLRRATSQPACLLYAVKPTSQGQTFLLRGPIVLSRAPRLSPEAFHSLTAAETRIFYRFANSSAEQTTALRTNLAPKIVTQ